MAPLRIGEGDRRDICSSGRSALAAQALPSAAVVDRHGPDSEPAE